MLISNVKTICALDTSNLRNMFGIFCVYIFGLRDSILENNHKVSTSSHLPNNLEKSSKDEKKTTDPKNNLLDISSTVEEIKFDPNNDYRLIHKNICICIKSALDSEKISAFHKNTREIIYVMVSLADEIFLNMDWKGKAFWETNMLESNFFGTQVAGEEIYKKIDELLKERNSLSLEKAEVYIKTLSLGFKGKFRGQDDEEKNIDIYRIKLFNFISIEDKSYSDATEYRIFQKEYTYTIPTIHRKLLPDSSIITYYSLFFVFIFLIISTFIWILETKDIFRLLFDISCIALRE